MRRSMGMAGDTSLDTQKMAANLAHLYRGEMARADAWRARLDTTTNWALTTTAAVVTLGLGSPEITHAVFLVGMYLVINFLDAYSPARDRALRSAAAQRALRAAAAA